MYKIKYLYRTGDSFGSEDLEEYLDLTWENLDVAKKNLKAIKEHHTLYELVNNQYNRDKEWEAKVIKFWEDCQHKDWYVAPPDPRPVKKLINEYVYETTYCLKLQADNGKFMQIHAPWCGYFETLYGAEIVEESPDMKFETGRM